MSVPWEFGEPVDPNPPYQPDQYQPDQYQQYPQYQPYPGYQHAPQYRHAGTDRRPKDRSTVVTLSVLVLLLVVGVVAIALNADQNPVPPVVAGFGPNSQNPNLANPLGSSNPLVPGSSGVAGGVPSNPIYPTAPAVPVQPSVATPSGTVAAPDGPSTADSRAVVERYARDVDSQNKTDAVTLICSEALAQYESSINAPDSDFSFVWSQLTYLGAGALGNRTTTVTYDVTLSRAGNVQRASPTFEVVDEGGAKICGVTY
ncbi:MAG TPA: hypothetical protein VK816_03365 [Jatrophihabitantaceae bacterium]|nr:hypothetical protein [Jatrophihabitantaceae bacterium]